MVGDQEDIVLVALGVGGRRSHGDCPAGASTLRLEGVANISSSAAAGCFFSNDDDGDGGGDDCNNEDELE